MNSAMILDNRVKGQLPLSVATSLAIEGLLGIIEDKPADPANPLRRYAQLAVNALNQAKQFLGISVPDSPVDAKIAPIKDYQELWINVRTLFRNVVGAMSSEDGLALTPIDYAHVILEEMAIIKGVLQDHGFNTSIHGYAASYNSLSGFYTGGRFKEVKTEKQKHYALLENATLREIMDLLGEDNDIVTPYDVTLHGHHKKTMVLTNYPVDLLNFINVSDLALIESHTGVIKTKTKWHTKLYNGKELQRIPFDKMTIQLFGDTGGLFAPYPKEYRDKMIELANQYEWNALTTKQRILQCVTLAREPLLEETVRKLYF